jgi:hypothetical protein
MSPKYEFIFASPMCVALPRPAAWKPQYELLEVSPECMNHAPIKTQENQLTLSVAASGPDLDWAQKIVKGHHYLHSKVDQRCSPFAYIVELNGVRAGCLIFGRPQATRCYTGKLTYGSLQDVHAGRAHFDRWEVINLARVWLDPRIQQGGEMYIPEAATSIIKLALARINYDYLCAHPPVDCNFPYEIRVVLSYCDTRKHKGIIYMFSHFRLAGINDDRIQTWFKVSDVNPLTIEQRTKIILLSADSPRSKRIRAERIRHGSQLSLDVL